MLAKTLNWNLFATDENKVSNFTPDSLESKFLAETNIDEMKDVDNMFAQPAAVTLNQTRLEKQQVPQKLFSQKNDHKSL